MVRDTISWLPLNQYAPNLIIHEIECPCTDQKALSYWLFIVIRKYDKVVTIPKGIREQ